MKRTGYGNLVVQSMSIVRGRDEIGLVELQVANLSVLLSHASVVRVIMLAYCIFMDVWKTSASNEM